MCKKFHFVLLFCLIFLFPFLISNGSIHTHAAVVNDSKYANMVLHGKTNYAFDIRRLGYETLKGYPIAQGGCVDSAGKYGYYIFLDYVPEEKSKTQNNNCIIVKVDLSKIKSSPNKAIEKYSKNLALGHANDICYNSKTGLLYVVHCNEKGNNSLKISSINPSTLILKATNTLNIPKTLPGATTSQLNSIKGISGISCIDGKYIVTISSNDSKFLVLNPFLSPIQYIQCNGKTSNSVNQGIDCDKNYIYAVRGKGKFPSWTNVIDIYNWKGEYKKAITLIGMHHEAESIYHIGSTFYVPCYAKTELQKITCHSFISRLSDKPSVQDIVPPDKDIVIKVGKTGSLKAKVVPDNAEIKTITYVSSNNKCVDVSQSGVCTGISPGVSTITMTSDQGYYETKRNCTVVGIPIIQKLQNEDKGIKITWKQEAPSTSITIYRSVGKFSSKYKKIATVKNRKNYFIDEKVKPTEFYCYKVSYENGKVETSKSEEAMIYCLATPKITKISSPQEKNAKISWDRVKGAARYRIYYDTDSNFKSPQKEVVNAKTDTAVINNLKSGKTYYFKVVANYKLSDDNPSEGGTIKAYAGYVSSTTSPHDSFSHNSNESPVKQIKIK